MKFTSKMEGDVGILMLKGKLIGQPETDELYNHVKDFLNRNINKIVIDCKYVSWLGSVGIGVLMRSIMSARSAGGDVRFGGISKKVLDLFSITKIIGIIQVYNSETQAIESFNEKNNN